MSTKLNQEQAEETQGKVKVGKLRLNRETLQDLSEKDAKQIRGGRQSPPPVTAEPC